MATSAVREAKNGGDFIDLVKEQTGLTVRVISGTEEARLIFLGIKNSVPMTEQASLAVDVGGGSVEIMAGNRINSCMPRASNSVPSDSPINF